MLVLVLLLLVVVVVVATVVEDDTQLFEGEHEVARMLVDEVRSISPFAVSPVSSLPLPLLLVLTEVNSLHPTPELWADREK